MTQVFKFQWRCGHLDLQQLPGDCISFSNFEQSVMKNNIIKLTLQNNYFAISRSLHTTQRTGIV
jgi:hypothetical protein